MCKCCKIPTIHVLSIVEGATTTTLNVAPFSGAVGCSGLFNICMNFDLSAAHSGNAIVVNDGVTVLEVFTCSGGTLRAWQLMGNRNGCCRFGQKHYLHARLVGDPTSITVRDCLPEACLSQAPFLPAAASRASLDAAYKSGKAGNSNANA